MKFLTIVCAVLFSNAVFAAGYLCDVRVYDNQENEEILFTSVDLPMGYFSETQQIGSWSDDIIKITLFESDDAVSLNIMESGSTILRASAMSSKPAPYSKLAITVSGYITNDREAIVNCTPYLSMQ